MTMTIEPDSVNGHKPERIYKERICVCGVKFTPTGPRNLYHSDDCPERPQNKAKAAEAAEAGETAEAAETEQAPALDPVPDPPQRATKPRARRRRRKSTAAKPKAEPRSDFLSRLESEVKDELQRVDLELGAEHAKFAQIEAEHQERIRQLEGERAEAEAIGKAITSA